jgi:preprotein translocase subunit YajC
MNFYLPRLFAFGFCLVLFFVGKYFQRKEKKRREQRKHQMANLVSSVVGLNSAIQAMQPTQTLQGLGSVQDQTQGRRFPN